MFAQRCGTVSATVCDCRQRDRGEGPMAVPVGSAAKSGHF